MDRILIIDDNELIREIIGDMLTSHGYEVAAAGTADEGNQALMRGRCDLVLLDIDLPDVDGVELCKRWRRQESTRRVPVIMITGHPKQQVRSFQGGADDYVKKPFDLDELLERIRAVLRRTRQAPEAAAEREAPVPGPVSEAPAAPSGPVPAATGRLAMLRAVLFETGSLPRNFPGPNAAGPYLLALVLVLNLGLFFAPGAAARPLAATLIALAAWGLAVTVLVVSTSILGAGLGWAQGAQAVTWAGLPVLLKLFGGCVLALATNLDPFLYSAGAALIPGAPESFLFSRLDLLELWSVVLLWVLLKRQKAASGASAGAAAAAVWASTTFFLLLCGGFDPS